METQISRLVVPPVMPDASGVKIKINTLLYGILPGWTTIAEMEMIAAHTFEAVDAQWKHGGELARVPENNAPGSTRDSGRFA